MTLRRSESRSKSASDALVDHFLNRSRKSTQLSPTSADQTSTDGSSNRRAQPQYGPTLSHLSVGGGASVSSGKAPVTPVDFTFPRRRHESVSNTAGYGSIGGETPGTTYSGRRTAQAIILDGLENASQEVYAILLEMIINKEINDRNRYVFPDLIIVAIFRTPSVPDNIPRQLLDYFAINGSYQFSTPQSRIQPVPVRRHALFRRTEWDELSKRMKLVTISNDMMRYVRDVIVGIRMHEAVHGGLTGRAALDLEAILKTLAAIFQATFVTPDLVTIAAEKVFSHRLELKSSRRRKMHAAANRALLSTSSSPTPTLRQGPTRGKTVLRGYQESYRHQEEAFARRKARRNSASSEQSSEEGASFVEITDSEDDTSSGDTGVIAGGTPKDYEHQQEDEVEHVADPEEEMTAADVVQDVLRVVYPPT
ncbi:hypothetical protein BGZ65_009643 [Modicella reniformis]|uniref:magnesium chelatase n=1 Tax=Modicella reniformis TaxID=1440133 RepID=A0A9P6LW59_9FUNG|nr:hypothetical protein BGZ65_009643 [Modicella reniformis]